MDFLAKDPKIFVHKGVFGNDDNDPRLYGSSSKKDGKITLVKKPKNTPIKAVVTPIIKVIIHIIFLIISQFVQLYLV